MLTAERPIMQTVTGSSQNAPQTLSRLVQWEPPAHLEAAVLDDAQLLGPLAQPLLPPQEGADAGVPHQLDGRLGRRPLVLRRRARGVAADDRLLLVVRLVGAAQRVALVWGRRGQRSYRERDGGRERV
jgi:hypothetical protein